MNKTYLINLLITVNNVLKPLFSNKTSMKSIIIIQKNINDNVININKL